MANPDSRMTAQGWRLAKRAADRAPRAKIDGHPVVYAFLYCSATDNLAALDLLIPLRPTTPACLG